MSQTLQYWCQNQLTVSVSGPDGPREHTFSKPFAIAGSHESCDIILADDSLPRRTLLILLTDYGLYCAPLVNSAVEFSTGWITPGQSLKCGNFTIEPHWDQIEWVDSELRRIELTTYGTTEPPIPEFTIEQNGKTAGKRRVRGLLSIVGRADPSLLRIPSKRVSSCHCALYWQHQTLWVFDLHSVTHTYLNNEQTELGECRLGDVIEIGDIRLKFSGFLNEVKAKSSAESQPIDPAEKYRQLKAKYRRARQDLEDEQDRLTQERAAWEEERTKFVQECEAWHRSREEYESNTARHEETIRRLAAKVESLQQELQSTTEENARLATWKTEHEEQAAQQQTDHSRINQDLNQLREDFAQANQVLTQLNNELVQTRDKLGQTRRELEESSQQRDGLENSLKEACQDRDIARTQIEHLRKEVESAQEAQTASAQELASIRTELESRAEEASESTERTRAELDSRDNDLMQLRAELESLREKHTDELEALEAERDGIEQKLAAAQQHRQDEIDDSHHTLHQLQHRIEQLEASKAEIEASNAKLSAQIEELTAEVSESEAARQADRSAAEAAQEKWSAESSQWQSKHEDWLAEQSKLKDRIAELEQELDEAADRLASAQTSKADETLGEPAHQAGPIEKPSPTQTPASQTPRAKPDADKHRGPIMVKHRSDNNPQSVQPTPEGMAIRTDMVPGTKGGAKNKKSNIVDYDYDHEHDHKLVLEQTAAFFKWIFVIAIGGGLIYLILYLASLIDFQ